MTQDQWTAVDRYIDDLFVPPDPTLDAALQAAAAAGLPPGGSLITLEADPQHAAVARANLARAGVDAVVAVRVGCALDTLPQLATEGRGPFDLVFIDADKPNTAAYFDWALKLTRRGSLIIADNVVRKARSPMPIATTQRAGRAALQRRAGSRAARDRHRHPDGRQQRLRWACARACDRRRAGRAADDYIRFWWGCGGGFAAPTTPPKAVRTGLRPVRTAPSIRQVFTRTWYKRSRSLYPIPAKHSWI